MALNPVLPTNAHQSSTQDSAAQCAHRIVPQCVDVVAEHDDLVAAAGQKETRFGQAATCHHVMQLRYLPVSMLAAQHSWGPAMLIHSIHVALPVQNSTQQAGRLNCHDYY